MDVITNFRYEVLNTNGRLYPKEIAEKALKDFLEEQKDNISAKMLGSLEHPSRIPIQVNNIDYGLQQTF